MLEQTFDLGMLRALDSALPYWSNESAVGESRHCGRVGSPSQTKEVVLSPSVHELSHGRALFSWSRPIHLGRAEGHSSATATVALVRPLLRHVIGAHVASACDMVESWFAGV